MSTNSQYYNIKNDDNNYLVGGLMEKVWDQEICFSWSQVRAL